MDWPAAFQRAFDFAKLAVIVYVAAINSIYFLLMALGFFVLRRDRARPERPERDSLMRSELLPTVSIIAPAHNEATTIRESVRSLLSLEYPSLEVIVVNDGSTDDTLQALIDEFRLYRSSRSPSNDLPTEPLRSVYESRDPIPLVVVDKEQGGKADALNAGLRVARSSLVAAVDADSLLEPGALLTVARPFLEHPDETLATGGIVRVVNGCDVRHGRVVRVATPNRFLPLFQTIEYMRAFLGGRVAFSFMNSLLVISGAFGMFHREAVIEAGGFVTSTVGEDMELVLRLHHRARVAGKPYRIVFVPDPVCWTEVPETFRVLKGQRNRWQRGTIESLTAHRSMLLNPKCGLLGMFAMPYFVLFEMLGPIVELTGYLFTVGGLAFGLISTEVAALFFTVSVVFGILLSMGAVLLEDLTLSHHPSPFDVAKLLAAAVVENLGFRQLMTLWRATGVIDGFRGKAGWGAMERRGFRSATAS